MFGGKVKARKRRHERVRKKISGSPDRPRLCVFRSVSHIYAQVIDDSSGRTLVCASTLDKEIRADAESKTKTQKAGSVGTLLARRAQDRGIDQVIFDRGGYKYHGRVKALAEGVRESGLRF